MSVDPQALLATYQDLKRSVCRANRGPADTIPIVHCQPVATEGALIIGLQGDGHPVDALPTAIIMLRAEHGPLEWVAFLHDGYIQKAPADLSNVRRGQMAEEFAQRADTDVREALTVSWRDATGKNGTATVTYGFDGPLPIFDEPLVVEGTSGNIDDALRLAF